MVDLKQGTNKTLQIEHMKTKMQQNQYHLDKTETKHDQIDLKCIDQANKID